MSDPKIRRIMVSPSDDQAELLPAEPVKSSLPIEAEEDDTDDKVSRGSYKPVLHYNAAVEVFEKPEYTSAGEEGSAGITIPRTIGLLGAVSFIVGTILGSGIFISPSGVAANSGSVAFTLCSWTICGLICMLAGLCYAEMGCVIRSSGADYAYLDAAFGSAASFIFSWCWAFLLTAQLAIMALAFSQYILTAIFNDGCGSAPENIKKILAVAALLLLVGMHVYSVELTVRIQIIFMVAKLFALTIIIVGGIVKLCQGHTTHLKTGFNNTETNPGTIAVGFYGGMFAYDAWNSANFIAEEIINPERNLPLAIIIGLPLCIVIYIMTNVSYFSVMSVADMIASDAVAITWAERVIPTVSWLIPIFVALSAFGTANGTLFTSARLLYVTGRNGHMPEVLGMVNVDSYTLSPSTIVLAVIAVTFTLVSEIEVLINFASFLQWIFYGTNMLSVIIFRYKAKYKDLPRPFKVPLVIPVFVFLCAMFIVVVPIATDPQYEFLYAAVFIAVGYLFYFPFVFFGLSLPFMKKVTMFVQLYLRVGKTKKALD